MIGLLRWFDVAHVLAFDAATGIFPPLRRRRVCGPESGAMHAAAEVNQMKNGNAIRIVATTALIVGAIDCVFASARTYTFGRSIVKLWQFVASGLLGQQAYSMGVAGALCGIVCHFLIMTIFAALVYVVYKRMAFVGMHPVISGLACGFFIWLAMSFIVVPFSKAGDGPVQINLKTLSGMIYSINFVTHLLLGLLLVLITKREDLRTTTAP